MGTDSVVVVRKRTAAPRPRISARWPAIGVVDRSGPTRAPIGR